MRLHQTKFWTLECLKIYFKRLSLIPFRNRGVTSVIYVTSNSSKNNSLQRSVSPALAPILRRHRPPRLTADDSSVAGAMAEPAVAALECEIFHRRDRLLEEAMQEVVEVAFADAASEKRRGCARGRPMCWTATMTLGRLPSPRRWF